MERETLTVVWNLKNRNAYERKIWDVIISSYYGIQVQQFLILAIIFFSRSRKVNRGKKLLITRIARARDETRWHETAKRFRTVVREPTINLRKWNWVNTMLPPKRAKCLPTDSCSRDQTSGCLSSRCCLSGLTWIDMDDNTNIGIFIAKEIRLGHSHSQKSNHDFRRQSWPMRMFTSVNRSRSYLRKMRKMPLTIDCH